MPLKTDTLHVGIHYFKKLMVHDLLKILITVHRHYQGSNILGKQMLLLWYQEPCDPWSCRFPSCDCGPRRPEQPVRTQTVPAFPFYGDLHSPSLSARRRKLLVLTTHDLDGAGINSGKGAVLTGIFRRQHQRSCSTRRWTLLTQLNHGSPLVIRMDPWA